MTKPLAPLADGAPPLSGLKVIEITTAMAGPFCGLVLGDYGADVVKIEDTKSGDMSRGWTPNFADGVAHYFASANRNKRSLSLDLKTPQGVAVLRRLAAEADVLVENFRVGALARMGLDHESLEALNPRLVYCSISGFGQTGPRAEEAANDVLMQAFAGSMSVTGEASGGPVKCGISIADIGGGLYATIGILLALEARERTGRGQFVDTSLMEGQIAMLSHHVTRCLASGRSPGREGSGIDTLPAHRAFATRDGWIAVAAATDDAWQGLCRAIGRQDWTADPACASASARAERFANLVEAIGERIATETDAAWLAKLSAEGVPCAAVNTVERTMREPQVLARDMALVAPHPKSGTVTVAGFPIKLSRNPPALRHPPPLLGEHADAILREAGYSAHEIDAMKESGIVGPTQKRAEGAAPARLQDAVA